MKPLVIPKPLQQQIVGWSAEEMNFQSIILESKQYAISKDNNLHLHLYNPQINNQEKQSKGKNGKVYNFFDNLRKYEKKRANQLRQKKEVNFIQKNIKQLAQEFNDDMYFINNRKSQIIKERQKSFNQKLQLKGSTPNQSVNCSLMMYYDVQKGAKKNERKDLKKFLRFQSSRISNYSEISSENNEWKDSHIKNDPDYFQKMLKLREGIKKRNQRIASESKDKINAEKQINSLRHTDFGYTTYKFDTKTAEQTKRPTRSQMNKRDKLSQQKFNVVQSKNMISISAKREKIDVRAIHSSKKYRPKKNYLNIKGINI